MKEAEAKTLNPKILALKQAAQRVGELEVLSFFHV